MAQIVVSILPRSPGIHIVGPWVIASINLYRDLRTGAQCIGNWASRGSFHFLFHSPHRNPI